MNILSRLNIGPRLAAAFAIVVALAVALVIVGVARMAGMNDRTAHIGQDRVPKVKMLADLTENVGLTARELRNAYIFDDPAASKAAIDAALAARQQNEAWIRDLEPRFRSAKGKALLAEMKAANDRYVPFQDRYIDMVRKGQLNEARALLGGDIKSAQAEYLKKLEAMVDFQIDQVHAGVTEVGQEYQAGKWLMIALVAAMAMCSAVLGWLITRSIVAPLARAVQVAEAVAAGNLGSRIETDASDEAGRLLLALRKMNKSLVGLVSSVRTSADSIATGSSQIASGSADLSQRTEEQAANVQQTAASMEQLASTVKNNADTARAAAQLAQSASGVATRGGQVVGQVVATMDDISASSRRIADIIGVIDGIAFQTNILALNAAVEAARAGEQGRGFAVVAGEVRTLAQRSAEAAREIKSLINASVEKVTSGGEQVAAAGQTMNEIVGQVKRVTDLISEISAASAEQNQGISQVGEAVTQMDQVTQQNAALVEQSAAAADSLRQQAESLVQAVSAFRLAA